MPLRNGDLGTLCSRAQRQVGWGKGKNPNKCSYVYENYVKYSVKGVSKCHALENYSESVVIWENFPSFSNKTFISRTWFCQTLSFSVFNLHKCKSARTKFKLNTPVEKSISSLMYLFLLSHKIICSVRCMYDQILNRKEKIVCGLCFSGYSETQLQFSTLRVQI